MADQGRRAPTSTSRTSGSCPARASPATSRGSWSSSPGWIRRAGPAGARRAVLWEIRWKLGALLGWDDEDEGLDGRVGSLSARLPEDLRDTEPPQFTSLPFTSLYLTDDEFAAEIANKTMHGVMHLGWVPAAPGSDAYRAQMTVLVKPNGLTGKAYMMAIRPFRHLIVYPAMMRQGRALWSRV